MKEYEHRELRKIREEMAQLDLKEAEYIEKKKALLSKYEEDKVHLNSEYKGLEEKVNHVDGEIESLAKSNEELSVQLKELVLEGADYENAIAARVAHMEHMDKQFGLKEAEKVNLTAHLDSIKNKLAQLEATSEGHKAMNDHLKAEKAKQEAKINELQQNRDKYQKEIEDTKNELQSQLVKCDELKKRIEDNMTNQVPQKFQDLQNSTSTTKMALVELRSKVASYPTEQTLVSDMQKYEAQIVEEQAKISNIQIEIEKHQKILNDCNKDGDVGVVKEAITEEIRQLKNGLVTLTKNIADKERQIEKFQNESESATKILDELDLQIGKANDARELREEDNRKDEASKEQLVHLTEENENLKQEISKVEQELNDYIGKRDSTVDQVQKKNTKAVQALENELRRLDQDISIQKKKLSEAEAKFASNSKANLKPDPMPVPVAQSQKRKPRRTLVSPDSLKTKEIAKSAPPPKAVSTLKSLWSSSEED